MRESRRAATPGRRARAALTLARGSAASSTERQASAIVSMAFPLRDGLLTASLMTFTAKILLLGSGELGQEFAISAKRLGA